MLQTRLTVEVAERYVVDRELARGGMAVVYAGRDLRHQRPVAIKVLDPALGSTVDHERFHREIALLARLQHPHVLPLLDSGEAAGSLYYVMPLVDGLSLRGRLQREGRLPVEDALRIAIEVADALAYAHARGIVHRDVKPENILLSGYAPPAGSPSAGGGDGGQWHALVCDFGIARLTGADTPSTARVHFTDAGAAIGTPAYMAPEQASAEPHVDGRADVWALGTVLYELLAGHAPFADGAPPYVALARRLTTAPPPVTSLRPELPREAARLIDATIARAAQPDPARRFASAGELRAALQECADALVRRRPTRRRVHVAAVAGALLAAGAVAIGALAWLRGRTSPPLDESLLVVLPFASPGSATGGAVDGRSAGELLLDALTRWTDLRVVSATRVHDAIARRGGRPPASLREARALARELRAGRLAWGTVDTRAGGQVVRAALYDVAVDDVSLREHRVEVRADVADLRDKFGALADSLLLGSARSRSAVAGALSTSSWPAWRAYDRGHDALARWALDTARAAFAEASALDPGYAHAVLWEAQTMAWMLAPPEAAWRAVAARAATMSARLSPRDRLTAQALAALAERRFPEACARYAALVARDSTDYTAWYGLGDCQARDGAIVRDASSASGWRFRSSYRAALAAYQRALSGVPSLHRAFSGAVVDYLPRLLVANGNELRVGGTTIDGASATFVAYPSLHADTLAFVPWPAADVAAVRPHTLPATTADATARNRQLLLRVAQTWADAFPRSPEVIELLATARESVGRLDGPEGALATLRRADQMGGADGAHARMALGEVRLLLKLGRLDEARRVAERLLARGTPSLEAAVAAALVGRPALAAALGSSAAPPGGATDAEAPSPPLEAARHALEAYAAHGEPAESVLAARDRVERIIGAEVLPARRAALRQRLLAPVIGLAVPTLGARALEGLDVRGDYLLEMLAAATRDDTVYVRRRSAELADARRHLRPTDLSLDGIYLESWLRAWAADTAGAARTLDDALEHLPGFGTLMIDNVQQAAALGRAIDLRARLARATGDHARARRWSGMAAVLQGRGP